MLQKDPMRYFLILAVLLLSSCSAIKPKADVELVNVQFGKMSLFQTELVTVISVDNEDTRELSLKGGVYRLYIDNTYVGKALVNQQLVVPPLSSKNQQITIPLNNLPLFGRIQSIVESGRFAYRIEALLHVDSSIGTRTVEITRDGDFNFQDFIQT